MSAELKAVVTKGEGDGNWHHCNTIQLQLFTRTKSEAALAIGKGIGLGPVGYCLSTNSSKRYPMTHDRGRA